MLTTVAVIVALAVGFVAGYAVGVLSCDAFPPHAGEDEAVSIKVTEGKDEF